MAAPPNPLDPDHYEASLNKTLPSDFINATILSSPPPPVSVTITPPSTPPHSSTTFSPAVIAIIGVLAAVFLLVSYYTMVAKYCTSRRSSIFRWRRSGSRRRDAGEGDGDDQDLVEDNNITWPLIVAPVSRGLDDSVIQTIPVVEYRKLDSNVSQPESGITDCAVCLSEFQEGEKLRLLPACCHSFHIGCIDMWLHSHANCPLCRSNVFPQEQQPSVSNVDSSSSAPATPTAADQPASGSPDSSQALLPAVADHHLHIIDEDNNTEETEDYEANGVHASRLRPLSREQKATRVLGHRMQRLGFRCFSTGRASMSPLAMNGHAHNFEGESGSGLDQRRMERSSSMSFFDDGRVISQDDDDNDHSDVNEQQAMMHIGHTVLKVGPSSSSSPSSSLSPYLPHENGTAMAQDESDANLHDVGHSRDNDQENIRDMKCLSLNLHNGHHDADLKNMPSDPLMARMALSLLGTRSVKRSFSGGRLFGFKVMQQKTNTGSSATNNNTPPPPSIHPTDETSSELPV